MEARKLWWGGGDGWSPVIIEWWYPEFCRGPISDFLWKREIEALLEDRRQYSESYTWCWNCFYFLFDFHWWWKISTWVHDMLPWWRWRCSDQTKGNTGSKVKGRRSSSTSTLPKWNCIFIWLQRWTSGGEAKCHGREHTLCLTQSRTLQTWGCRL